MFLFMPLFYHCGTKRETVKHALAQRSTAGKLYTFLVIQKNIGSCGSRCFLLCYRAIVWCFVVSGIQSVDRLTESRVSESSSWAVARQRSELSGVSRFPVSDQSTDWLSGIWVTVLGWRPTEERSVWCFAVFGIRSVERRTISHSKRPSFWDKNLFLYLSVSVNVFLDFWTGYRMVR